MKRGLRGLTGDVCWRVSTGNIEGSLSCMVQAGWRPTVDNYLGRVTKPRILDAVRQAKGESSAQLIDHLKKADMMAESHWIEADRGRFAAAWVAELAEVPQFTESTIHVVAGLLLPIWKRLPNESTRVYRLQTDAGERIIGRKFSATWVANVLSRDAPALTPDAAFAALMEGRTVLDLAEELQLRRVRVMGAYRIELSGFNDTIRDRLRAYGLFGEIISWKLRMFVPTDASGIEVLSRVLDTYPVTGVSEREAA